MRIVVTGARDWPYADIVALAILDLKNWYPLMNWDDVVIVHGAAKGADSIARDFAIEHGLAHEPHPADWQKYGKSAGPIRNKKMVDLGADVVLAFLRPESRGTKDCIEKAAEASLPIIVYREVDLDTEGTKGIVQYAYNGAMFTRFKINV